VLAHSKWDALLVVVCGLQLALTGYAVWAYPLLPWPSLVGLGALIVFLTCTNYQCTTHYQIHTPFFRAKLLNRLFSLVSSLAIGMPTTLYRFHHLNHHRFNNDVLDPETGTTQDASSTYRHGRNGRAEGILTYALLSIFRTDLVDLFRQARKKQLGGWVAAEALLLLAAVAAIALYDWRAAVTFCLPVWILGQAGAFAENYLEHHGAIPGDRRTDSVSSYGWLYNKIWFNNGYHQEHHYKPQVHWTELRAVRSELPPEEERIVAPIAHWFHLRGALFGLPPGDSV